MKICTAQVHGFISLPSKPADTYMISPAVKHSGRAITMLRLSRDQKAPDRARLHRYRAYPNELA